MDTMGIVFMQVLYKSIYIYIYIFITTSQAPSTESSCRDACAAGDGRCHRLPRRRWVYKRRGEERNPINPINPKP